MDQRVSVCVVGNSVGFRIRPPRQHGGEATYSEHLQRLGFEVRTVCRSGVTIAEAFGRLEEDVLTYFPKVVIVQFGIVELCYRRTVRRLNNATIRNYYLNSIAGRPYQFWGPPRRLWTWVRRAVNVLTARTAGALGIRWQWLSTSRFLEVLDAMLEAILKETAAHVFVLGIPPPSPRVERILAGSSAVVADANSRMANRCRSLGPRAAFVEPGEWLDSDDVPALLPDGIHLSSEAHRRLAAVLARLIENATAARG